MARHPEKFAYVGVFSSGIIARQSPTGIDDWAKEHARPWTARARRKA